MNMTDAALVKRVVSGDVDAYAILVDRYYDRCTRFAWQMLGDREDAEEAVQDAFVRAYRSLEHYEDRQRFGGWVLHILVNRCRSAGAKRSRHERTFVHAEVALLAAFEEHPSERTAWREEIERALALLGEGQREAFLLKYVEDLSYEEMAEITGVGISALKMRVKRACERLRELLEEVYSA
jgi:RNA polymerase sigma-70 factor (ECF subfamily)